VDPCCGVVVVEGNCVLGSSFVGQENKEDYRGKGGRDGVSKRREKGEERREKKCIPPEHVDACAFWVVQYEPLCTHSCHRAA